MYIRALPSSSRPVVIRDAPYPFNKPQADAIIRSFDMVDFRVRRSILCEASPVFEHMFSLPQPSTAGEPVNVPIIPVTEGSRTLSYLLQLCYPIDDPVLECLEDVRAVLEAAMKYLMEEAVKLMKRRLLEFAATDSLRVWGIACRYGLESEASAAAKVALSQEIVDIYFEELEEIPAGAYYRLLQYHRHPKKAIFRLLPSVPSRPQSAKWSISGKALAHILSPSHPMNIFNEASMRNADIVLRSSEGVNLFAHKVILAFASPVLRNMITSASAHTVATGECTKKSLLAVVSLPEDCWILGRLLSLCYPVDDPILDDLQTIRTLLEAVLKYQMQEATKLVMHSLMDYASRDPIGVYAIASRYSMRREAEVAAKCLLHHNDPDATYSPELEEITAGSYFRLLKYYRACALAASDLSGELQWVPDNAWIWFTCSTCDRRETFARTIPQTTGATGHSVEGQNDLRNARPWWDEYVQNTARALRRRPCADTVDNPELTEPLLRKAMACPKCRTSAFANMRRLTELFATEIDRAVGTIELEVT